MLNEIGMAKSCQIKIDCTSLFNELLILKLIKVETGAQHQILFFIIKDFHGKFHHSIRQRLLKFHYLYRLLTIQEINSNNPRHNILEIYIILFILIEQNINHASWIIRIFNEIFGMLFLCSFNMVACRWRRQHLSFWMFTIFHYERSFHTPSQMAFYMAVHEPHSCNKNIPTLHLNCNIQKNYNLYIFFPLLPFPSSWCRSCHIVTKIEGKNINYIPIILTLGKSAYFNFK